MSTIASRAEPQTVPAAGGTVPLRALFVKHTLAYPRAAGHDIRTYNLMRAMKGLGHVVGLATVTPPSADAVAGIDLDLQSELAARSGNDTPAPTLTTLQARYASYFGVPVADMQAVAAIATDFRADVVIGVGADILPYLAGPIAARRVWYAGDEWVSHYASLWKPARPGTYRNLREAAIWGLYQRAFAPLLDRVWVVSDRERRAMRRWAGIANADALPNGVDTRYYGLQPGPEAPRSAVFWGRLDFWPNLQALDWFCRQVWPGLRRQSPGATFRIIGFAPGPEAQALARIEGVVLSPDEPDIRPAVGRATVVVLPFHSGGGIKNKLLEAASMGKAIVCTPLACGGLRGQPPLALATRPQEWIEVLGGLWRDDTARRALGARAREWALDQHAWSRTAADAVASLRPPG